MSSGVSAGIRMADAAGRGVAASGVGFAPAHAADQHSHGQTPHSHAHGHSHDRVHGDAHAHSHAPAARNLPQQPGFSLMRASLAERLLLAAALSALLWIAIARVLWS